MDEQPIDEHLFRQVHEEVVERDRAEKIGATPFELLTVTAFEVFTREKVQVAVVETGMGGRDDATNILQHKLAAVLTDIGLDHQKFLGDTVEEIAKVKAGIIKPRASVIYSARNVDSVQQVIKQTAEQNQVKDISSARTVPTRSWPGGPPKGWVNFRAQSLGEISTRTNLALALKTFVQVRENIPVEWGTQRQGAARMYQAVMESPGLPGRMQTIDITSLVGEDYPNQSAVLDGAHNEAAAITLQYKVRENVRKRLAGFGRRLKDEFGYQPIVWVIGHTQGRDVEKFLSRLCWPDDSVATVEFGPVDGMPWVEPMSSIDLAAAVSRTQFTSRAHGANKDLEDTRIGVKNLKSFGRDIEGALSWAASQTENHIDGTPVPIVVTGSLYLCSDVLRSLRENDAWEHPSPQFSQDRLPPVSWEDMAEADAKQQTDQVDKPILGRRPRHMASKPIIEPTGERRTRGRPVVSKQFLEKYKSATRFKPFLQGWHERIKREERRKLAEMQAKSSENDAKLEAPRAMPVSE